MIIVSTFTTGTGAIHHRYKESDQERMGASINCTKYLLILFNFIFWLSGAALLSIGIYLLISEETENYRSLVDDSSKTTLLYISFLIVAVGACIFVVGFFGCCGAIKESRCLISFYMVFLLMVMCGELAIGVFTLLYRQTWDEHGKEILKENMLRLYSDNMIAAKFIDKIQLDNKCCGAISINDWIGESPASCCPAEIARCTTTASWKVPCWPVYNRWFKRHSSTLIGIGIGVACIQLFGMLASICLCCALSRAEY
ncbi:hypothetical protein SNEBB_001222 [Seison nebaliae]|nr:hypothetical protein SNEBB_001222 [Seison nebaliae]